ncbi:MAG: hypothetical protein KJ882_13775, partial [Proteobacteria bacterium]|nr:hypothetical protein [Pseudomonadota bacterium]
MQGACFTSLKQASVFFIIERGIFGSDFEGYPSQGPAQNSLINQLALFLFYDLSEVTPNGFNDFLRPVVGEDMIPPGDDFKVCIGIKRNKSLPNS